MLDSNMRIKALYISDKYCEQLSAQSCDCDKLLIETDDSSYVITHQRKEDDGYIEIKSAGELNLSEFTYAVELGSQEYELDKIKYLDNRRVDGIRFRSKKSFLFIFALEDNLTVTLTTYDLFEEIETEIPLEEDEPQLRLKS